MVDVWNVCVVSEEVKTNRQHVEYCTYTQAHTETQPPQVSCGEAKEKKKGARSAHFNWKTKATVHLNPRCRLCQCFFVAEAIGSRLSINVIQLSPYNEAVWEWYWLVLWKHWKSTKVPSLEGECSRPQTWNSSEEHEHVWVPTPRSRTPRSPGLPASGLDHHSTACGDGEKREKITRYKYVE